MTPRSISILLGLAIMLTGCGIRLPNTGVYLANCSAFDAPASAMPGEAIFFASTNLLDCRKSRMQMVGFRYNEMTRGFVPLRTSQAVPWIDPAPLRLTDDDWRKTLKARIDSQGNNGRLLVFVHGYNNSFTDAIERSYKLSQLYFEGVPTVAVAWPSRNKVQSYVYDEASIAWSQTYLNDLLVELSGVASDITLVGHSMGSRAVIDAVIYLNAQAANQANTGDRQVNAAHVRRIVLASADVDRDRVMRAEGAIDDLLEHDRKVLVYASHKDRPISASRSTHGYGRLGSSDCRYDVTPELQRIAREQKEQRNICHMTEPKDGLSVVETSLVSAEGFLKHSDFVDAPQVRGDLANFLRGCDDAPWRTQDTFEYEDTRPDAEPGSTIKLVGYRLLPDAEVTPCASVSAPAR